MKEQPLAKWLRWLIYASALVPLIIFSQYISPFHFGKVVVLRSIVQVMVVLYLLLIWRDRSYLPKGHPILWAFVAFTAAFTLTSITSVAPMQSYWGSLERMGGLFTFWHYLVFFIITVSVLRTRRDWQMLLDIMIGVGVASAIYGFLQKTDWALILGSGGRARPFGTIGNAALFAGYQILVAYLALTLSFMKRTAKNMRIWYWIAGGTTLLAAISTAVRGSLIGIVVGALVWALLWSTLNHSKKAKMALLAGLSWLVVFVFLAMMLRDTPLVQNSPYLTRITDFSSSTYTVQTRFWAWEAGLKGWSENPKTVTLGWGPENFNIPFSKYFNPKFFTGPGAETYFDRAHNMFMEVLVTMGLVGLLAYISIFVMLFRTLAKMMRASGDERVIGIGFTSMTVAYMIHNCFIFDTSANFLTFFMLLAYTMHIAQRGLEGGKLQTTDHKPQMSKRWTGAQMLAAVVMGIAAAISVYATNIRPTSANYASTRAIIAGWQGNWTAAVNKYREAIEYGAQGRYEFRNRFAQYLLEYGASVGAAKTPNFTEVTMQAISDLQDNSNENPQDYIPYLYISRLYLVLGKDDPKSPYNDSALEYSMKALEVSPTFVRTYFEIAQAYLNKKEHDKAYEWFSKALELNPDVSLTKWYVGVVRIQQGQFTGNKALIQEGIGLAVAALKDGYALTESDAQKLASAYLSLGDLKNIAELYKQLLVAFPQKTSYWEQLIAVYIRMGDKDSAIATIRQALLQPAVSADPVFRAKAENTLRELGAN